MNDRIPVLNLVQQVLEYHVLLWCTTSIVLLVLNLAGLEVDSTWKSTTLFARAMPPFKRAFKRQIDFSRFWRLTFLNLTLG